LHMAARRGNVDVIGALLDDGAKLLLARGADPGFNSRGIGRIRRPDS
jgi:hypothetical protein